MRMLLRVAIPVEAGSILKPALAHVNEPVHPGRVEWLPFTLLHGLSSLELGDAGCKLSSSDDGSLAICPDIFSSEFLGCGAELEICPDSHQFHASWYQ